LNAKFGLFIHWGAYAAAGIEASWPVVAPYLAEAKFSVTTRISKAEYTALALKFNPLKFNADEVVIVNLKRNCL